MPFSMFSVEFVDKSTLYIELLKIFRLAFKVSYKEGETPGGSFIFQIWKYIIGVHIADVS